MIFMLFLVCLPPPAPPPISPKPMKLWLKFLRSNNPESKFMFFIGQEKPLQTQHLGKIHICRGKSRLPADVHLAQWLGHLQQFFFFFPSFFLRPSTRSVLEVET